MERSSRTILRNVPQKIKGILVPALLLFLLLVALILLLNSLIQNPSVQRYLLGEVSKVIKGFDNGTVPLTKEELPDGP
jgi:hypothetical protein